MKKRYAALLLCLALVLLAGTAFAASYEGVAQTGNIYELQVGDTLYITNPHSASSYGLVMYNYMWTVDGSGVVSIPNIQGRSTTIEAVGPGVTTVKGWLDGSVEVRTPQIRYNPVTGKKETYYITTYSSREYLGTATIKVADNISPEITSQPADAAAPSGSRVTTAVTVSDHSALSYQWYVKNPGSSSFVKSSVTSSGYGCTMNESISGRQVYCIITDSSGNQTRSETATLSLLGIKQQPENVVAELGNVASTTLKAEGEGLTYQWYIAKKGSSSFSKSSVARPTYNMKVSESNTGRQAYCVVTNKYGQSIRSNTVTLRKPVDVKITTQPTSKFAADGKKVSVSVKAQGDGLTYQWYYKNAGASRFSKASITGPTYSVTMNDARSGRQLYCVVTDKFGDTAKSNTVTIARFAITRQPANLFVLDGDKISTSIQAEGDGLKYQWYIKNPGASSFTKSSLTGTTYSYIMTRQKSGRQAYCVITDQYGNKLTTKTVSFRIPDLPTVTVKSSVRAAKAGGAVSATVEATGQGLTYQWYIKSAAGTSFSKSSITGKTYSFAMTQAKSGRQAYCVVTDQYGRTAQSRTITFSLLEIADLTAERCAGTGETVSAVVSAKGEGLKYQWYIKSATGTSFNKSSVTGKTYSYAMTQEKSGRQAYCIVTDKYGNSVRSETVTFSLLAFTDIYDHYWFVVTSTGASQVNVFLTAEGSGLTYQWYQKDHGTDEYIAMSNGWTNEVHIDNNKYYATGGENVDMRLVKCIVTDEYGNSISYTSILVGTFR